MPRLGKLTLRDPDWSRQGPLEVQPGGVHWGIGDWEAAFGRPGPYLVELGPGKGDWLIEMAARRPEANLVAIEIKRARVVWIEEKLLRLGIRSVRLVSADALEVLPTLFPPGSLAGIYVNFPDPWPRTRHSRRRLGGEVLALAAAQLLRVGGELVYVTDQAERAAEAHAVFAAHPSLADAASPQGWLPGLEVYPATVHERKFRAQGREIRFLRFTRRP